MMRNTITRWAVCAFLTIGLGTLAQAQDWDLTVTPYGWMAGLDGEISAGGISAPVDLSFSDVLEDVDVAAMLSLDGNNGTWGVQGDVLYINLSDSQGTAAGTVKADLEQWIISITPYLRVKSDDTATVDIGAGGRYIDTDADLSTPAGERSESRNWIDPVVMARVRVPLSRNWSLTLNGDVGGFGVESDFTWQIAATAGYSISENMEALIGYRHLDVDYQDGEFGYDVATSGAGVGLRISL